MIYFNTCKIIFSLHGYNFILFCDILFVNGVLTIKKCPLWCHYMAIYMWMIGLYMVAMKAQSHAHGNGHALNSLLCNWVSWILWNPNNILAQICYSAIDKSMTQLDISFTINLIFFKSPCFWACLCPFMLNFELVSLRSFK